MQISKHPCLKNYPCNVLPLRSTVLGQKDVRRFAIFAVPSNIDTWLLKLKITFQQMNISLTSQEFTRISIETQKSATWLFSLIFSILRIVLLKAILAAGKREKEFWLLKNVGIGKMAQLQFTICNHHPCTQEVAKQNSKNKCKEQTHGH